MTPDVAARVVEATGYCFKDPALLEAAMTHASYAGARLDSNERLEFFGDSVLGIIVCEELYRRFPHFLEGELTKIKSAVVSRRTCARIARHRQLDRCILLGKGMSDREQLPNSLLAAVYEALIGAVYFDGGLEAVRQFILSDMGEQIDAAVASQNQHNYKSHLQQHAQKFLNATPVYEMLDEKGPDHSKCFEVCVMVDARRFSSAWGPSKKEAEQRAAYVALCELEVLDPQQDPGIFQKTV
jgi:ribonuclease-3